LSKPIGKKKGINRTTNFKRETLEVKAKPVKPVIPEIKKR